MDNEEIIAAVANELDISYDAAERFLDSETGCFADIDGERIWMSGQLISRILNAIV